MEEKIINNLNKEYSSQYKKVRRFIINLYRPILHSKNESVFNQHPMFYIMVISCICSAVLLFFENPNHYYPFCLAWCIIPITWVYLKLFPQTWSEMYEYEKKKFREIWKLPTKWTPKQQA